MKLVTYRAGADGEGRLGVMQDDMVVDVERLGLSYGAAFPGTMLDLIDLGPDALAALKEALDGGRDHRVPGVAVPAANVKLLAPIPRPRKNIFGIGLNYVAHIDESRKPLDAPEGLPDKPVVFSKPPTAVIGPGDPIQHNANITQQLDWEVELAVIIGRRATRITTDEAMACVFGYSVMVDISARDNDGVHRGLSRSRQPTCRQISR